MNEDKLKIVLDREAETIRRYDAKLEAAKAEAATLRRERDEARDQFDHHVVWASDQSVKLEAEAAALREALREIDGLAVMELNPSNYNHDDVCELSRNASYASVIARAALKENHDGL